MSPSNGNKCKQTKFGLTLVVSCIIGTISACTGHDGLYQPACIAFEGDRVLLSGDRFEWQKFTDQRNIDAQGSVIDPFPGYPKSGTFDVDGRRVAFQADDGTRFDGYFLVSQDDSRYLMTEDQHASFEKGGALPRCVLKLATEEN